MDLPPPEPTDDELRAFIAERLLAHSKHLVEETLANYRDDWLRQYRLAQQGKHLNPDGSESPNE